MVAATLTTSPSATNRMKCLSVVSIFLLLGISPIQPALSHSGGTDSDGGHTNRKTGVYHYHNAGSTKGSPSSNNSSNYASGNSSSYSTNRNTNSRVFIPKTLKESSGLSQEDYDSSGECDKFTFSEIMRQSSTGQVNLRCGQVIMSIKAH
jgi:hypothetical protein